MMKKKALKYIISSLGLILIAAAMLGCGEENAPEPETEEEQTEDGNDVEEDDENDENDDDTDRVIENGLGSFDYRPGYGDMNGESHYVTLQKDGDDWVIISWDCEGVGEPMIITTYATSERKVARFYQFLVDNDVASLADRKDSDEFMTDYCPWSYSFRICDPSAEVKEYESYSIDQYKEYSDEDYELISKMNKRFENLRGRELSREKEKKY